MGKRRIRLRPVRRDEIDVRRLAAALAAMAANTPRPSVSASQGDKTTTRRGGDP